MIGFIYGVVVGFAIATLIYSFFKFIIPKWND